MVETAKKLRDAIVHASPAPDTFTLDAEKETSVHGVQFETCEELVDTTVMLIRKLEATVNHSEQRLKGWLYARLSDGEFPEKVFE